MSANLVTPDLTQRPPRSARVRLGGYVILPRMLDKGRASLSDKNGEYHYDCPIDRHFLKFAGIDADQLKQELSLGKSDSEILEWIHANSSTQPKPWEIISWSSYHENRTPGDVESKEFFTEMVAKLSKTREDISTWFDFLDLDDFTTYGGKA